MTGDRSTPPSEGQTANRAPDRPVDEDGNRDAAPPAQNGSSAPVFGPPTPPDLPETVEMPEVKAASASTVVYRVPTSPPSSFEVRTEPKPEPGAHRPSAYAEPEVDRRERFRARREAAEASRPVAGPPAPRHMRGSRPPGPDERRRAPAGGFHVPPIAVALAPVVALALLVVAWAVDSTIQSGQVLRNVELGGQQIGGQSEDSLPDEIGALAEELAARPVTIKTGPGVSGLVGGGEGTTYTTTAGQLGLALDEQATIDAAMDAGRDDAFLIRPFKWLASFFSPQEVSVEYTLNEMQLATELQRLQGADLTSPVEPTIAFDGTAFAAVPGRAGLGIDPEDLIEALPEAARAVEGSDEGIEIDVDKSEVRPRFSNQEAQELADRANTMTANGLTAEADGTSAVLAPEQLRAWITPTVTEDGMDLAFDAATATAAAPSLFGELGAEPRNARVELQNGTPVVVPGQNGVACCGADAGDKIWTALTTGQPSVAFEATITEPERTTEEVQSWGITQPVGGSRGWQGGSPIDGPRPGFTTFHDCCQARVTNIHRIADLVDGALIASGETFSVNSHVGPRTEANGFVLAGAIREGQHVDEIGGGVSQFATTLFNAAYFAGLDITTYQAHTEYFSRYPRGREATMGYPAPDLKIQNSTPYGVLIDTSHTGTSLTITLYSTPYATAEQTNISESARGACTVVTTTRTRTFPDGTTRNDNFSATYRPGEGQTC